MNWNSLIGLNLTKLMKITCQAPHMEGVKRLDCHDKKVVKSYNDTRKRKIRALRRVLARELEILTND